MIEPVFEDLAHVKTRGTGAGKVAFAKVDLAVGMSSAIARQYNVAATPTFAFLLGREEGVLAWCFSLLGLGSDEARRFTS
jgi:hypothetical protein